MSDTSRNLFYMSKNHRVEPAGKWNLDNWLRRLDGVLRGKIRKSPFAVPTPAVIYPASAASTQPLFPVCYLERSRSQGAARFRKLSRLFRPIMIGGLMMLLASALCFAQDYYVSPNGSDQNAGSSASPWGTFGKAWGVLRAGDTLIVKDGTYSQSINPSVSGTSAAPITIKAENDGKAVIDGGGARSGISIVGKSYLVLEGFRVQNPGERPSVEVISPDGTAIANQTNNITIRRVGARGGAMTSNNHVWTVARVRDTVLEDVWGWGNGRYVMNVYGGTRITVRRAVLRWDAWGIGADKPGDPKFNMGVYNTHDSLFENILLIDAASTALAGDKGGLYVPGNSNGPTAPYTDSDNNRFYGLIAMNNVGHGVAVEGGSGGPNDNNQFFHLVSWKNTGHGFTVPKNAANTQFVHATLGANYRGGYSGGGGNNVGTIVLTNSVVTRNSSYGLNGPVSSSYNNVHGNGSDYNGGASAGSGTISQDPLMDYIPRQEADSPDKRTASDGGDRGSTVVNRYQNGSLTSTPLWPWSNEARIKTDICEGATRGLCAASGSLTNYVWETLGNPTPADFGAPAPSDTAAPSTPAGLSAVAVSSTQINLAWTASTDNVAVAGYKVHRGGVLLASVAGTSYSDAGLSPSTLYSYTVSAFDAAGNASGLSVPAAATTAAIPAPPPPAPAPGTAVFQQGLDSYAGTSDTWINSYSPTTVFDAETKLYVTGTEGIKSVVRFDLSSIPAGAVITSATVSLYNYAHAGSANSGTVSVHRVNRSWTSSQVTWNSAATGSAWAAAGMQSGTDYTAAAEASLAVDTGNNKWRDFNVTAAMQNWVAGTSPNHGLVFRSGTNGAKPYFYSAAHSVSSLRPKLTVVYTLPAPANSAPTAAPQSAALNEDSSAAVTLAGSDPDGDALSYALASSPAHGVLIGTAPNLTYTPTANYNGADAFTFRVTDARGAQSAPAAVSLTVASVNDAPTAVSSTATATEDGSVTIRLNASDADGDALTYLPGAPAHGTLSGTGADVVYTPAPEYAGTDSFTFKARDPSGAESATVQVDVTIFAQGDVPSADDATVVTDEDSPKSFTLTGADPDGDALSYALLTPPAHGALTGAAPNLTYTPAANYHGSDAFTFRVTDAQGAQSAPATLSLSVLPVNDAPAATSVTLGLAEDSSSTLVLTAADPDGDALSYLVTSPAHGTLQGTAPNLTYVPASNFFGADSFTFQVTDSSGASSALSAVALNVAPVNDAPAVVSSTASVSEDGSVTIRLNASDADGDTLTYLVGAAVHGTLSGTGPNVVYTPETNYEGTDLFVFKARDPSGAESAEAQVAVTVLPGNDAPVAAAGSVLTNEDISKTITLTAVDPDGDSLTYRIVKAPLYGRLTGTPPLVTYVPTANTYGTDSFTFRAKDASGADSNVSTVTVTVYPVNDIPLSYPRSITTYEGSPKAVALSAYDVDRDTLTWEIVRPPARGSLSGAAPALTYTPAPGTAGLDNFTFRVLDQSGAASNVSTVSVTVYAMTDGPAPDVPAVEVPADNPDSVNLAGGPVRLHVRAGPSPKPLTVELLLAATGDAESAFAAAPVPGNDGLYEAVIPMEFTAFRLGSVNYRARVKDAWGQSAVSAARSVHILHSVETALDGNLEARLPATAAEDQTAAVNFSSLPAAERPASISLRRLEFKTLPAGPEDRKPVAAFEITADRRVSSVFSRPLLISLSYPDKDANGVVDGTSIRSSTLRVYYYDGQKWRLMGGRVHPDTRLVSVHSSHFTTFGLFSQTPSNAPAMTGKPVFLTPVPLDGHNDSVSFPAGIKRVEVHDLNGTRVFAADGDGFSAVTWTGRDDFGRVAESGSYIARVVDAQDRAAYQLVILAK